MANLNKLYSQFNDKITLTSSKTDSLRTSRNALRTDIKNWFSNKSKLQPKFCWQGSFAMKTVINTIGDNEYDLDDGVYIRGYDDVELEDWPVASTVHKWVKDAVSERTKKDPADKKTCIRVTYADGYHIDLPMYIVKDDTAFLAHKTNGWIESDPKAFKEWFVSKVQDEQYGDQLRRLVKVLKAWKDYNEIDLKGVELTILATNAFDKYDDRDDKSFRNTINNIISNLENDFKCIKPVTPGENLFERFDEDEQEEIISAFKNLKESMDNALDEEDESKAADYLRNIYGTRFPKGTSSALAQFTKSAAPGVLRHDGRSA